MPKFAEELLHRHKYSVVEYHRLGEAGVLRADERVELIEGEIIDRAPIGSRLKWSNDSVHLVKELNYQNEVKNESDKSRES